ncbi:MAG: hypothetical protein ACJASL_003888 [Paraglaciecola sp.]|jgi:hypothetical protein
MKKELKPLITTNVITVLKISKAALQAQGTPKYYLATEISLRQTINYVAGNIPTNFR